MQLLQRDIRGIALSGQKNNKETGSEKSWDDIIKSGKYSLSKPDPWVIEKLREFRKIDGGAYLDLGCGLGRHVEPLSSDPGVSIGLDCSRSALQATTKRTNPSLNAVQASMTEMPFKDSVFGTILAWRSIYLLQNAQIDMAVREVYRVLRKCGHLLCSIRSTTNTLYFAGKEKGKEIEPGTFKFPEEEFRGAVYHFFSKEEIIKRFKDFEIHDLHNSELTHTAFTINRPEYKNNFWVFWAVKK
ncbi:MAG: class I SAM-dependent methyltransferase [Spirochaetes bacterium]|nr:class I SAM-dependent methyltransferase [Spirochaetota bacterium]